jgi:DnaJ-class molecular chaperone
MSKDTRLFVRIDSDLKRQYEAELRRKGLTISQHLTDKIKELVVYSTEYECDKCSGTGNYTILHNVPGTKTHRVSGFMKCEQCKGTGKKQEAIAR